MMNRPSLQSLSFPVAMRKSVQDDVVWNSIFAHEESEDFSITGRDYTILRPPTNVELSGLAGIILTLPGLESWHTFITLTVIVNYILGMLCFYFFPNHLRTYMWFYLILDAIYFFNLILCLMHHYGKKIKQKYQMKTKSAYLIIVDIVSLLPQEGIVGLLLGFSHPLIYYCRFVTYIRLYRVPLLFHEILGSVREGRCRWFIVQYIMLYSIAVHTAVCLWYHMSCRNNGCRKIFHWTSILNEETLHIDTVGRWYLLCLYIALTLITNTGFGDFYATTLDEGVYCIIVCLSGYMLICGLIAVLTVQLLNLRYRKSKFANDLQTIEIVLHHMNASPELTDQVRSYYNVLWKNKTGIKDAPELYNLPNPLRMELMYDINIAHLQNSLLLKNQPEALLRKIALLIEHVFLLPGDVFFYQGVVKNKLVFIASGALEILSEEDDQSPIICFKAGTVLGEIALLLTVPAKATVRAAKYTELQIIKRQDFMRMMLDHPDTSNEVKTCIAARIKLAEELRVIHTKDHVIMNMLVSHAEENSPIKLLKDHLSSVQKDQQLILEQAEAMSVLINDDGTASTSNIQIQNFDGSCLPLYKLAENVTMIEPPRVCVTQKFPWILDPHSHFVNYWNALVDFSQICLCLIFPYFIVYERNMPETVSLYGVLADCIYAIDIYIRCTTAVVLRNRAIKSFKKILDHHMRSAVFYIDVFSLFPIEIAIYGVPLSEDEKNRFYYFLKLNRMLRIHKLHNLFVRLEEQSSQNILIFNFIKYGIYLLLSGFCAGALLYTITCMYPICNESSWFYYQMTHSIQLRHLFPCFEHPVAMSTYFGINCLLLLGYGDILPNNDTDIIAVSLLMLVGMFLICYCTAQLCTTFSLTEQNRRDFQENIIALGRFMERNNLMHSLNKRVITFFQLQWDYDRGTGRDFLLGSAPPHLRSALQSTELTEALSQAPLFQMVDEDFLMLIAEGARVQVLPPNEVIAYSGDMSREMYILLSGHCQVLSDFGQVQSCYGPGAQFGDIEMIYGIPKRYTVKTTTNCKVISVDFRIYVQTMSMFPAIFQETKRVMNEPDLIEWVSIVNLERMRLKSVKIDVAAKRLFSSYVNWMFTFFRKSFIATKHKCGRSKGQDDYWAPFRKMGKLGFVGYFLLPGVIHPRGPFIQVWCFIRIISIFTACMFNPFYIAVSPYVAHMYWIMLATNICAYVDIYLLMHLAYYNDNGLLITHPKYTALNYLKHSFTTDFLAVFPFMLLVRWENPSHNEGHSPIGHIRSRHLLHCIWRLNSLIQFHRIPELFHYLETDLLRNIYLIRFFKFVPLTMVLINLIASLIFGLHCNYVFSTTRVNDSMSEIIITDNNNTEHYGYLRCSRGAWLDKSHFNNLTSPSKIYLIAVYWVTSTILGVGMGDVTAHSKYNMYIVILSVLIGRLLFAYVFANLATGRAQLSRILSEYQENLKDLMAFLKSEAVDFHWQDKLIKYFEYVWRRTSGVRSQELCRKLNTALMEDTVVFLYENTLREVPLFENVEKSFIRVIAKHLTEQYFRKGDTVIRSYDVQSNIYIIYRGKVEVLSSYNEMIACMGPGGLFGNIRQIYAGCSSISIVASRNLDLLMISSETFYNVIKDYPRIKRNMETLLHTVTDYIMPTTIIDEEIDNNSETIPSENSNPSNVTATSSVGTSRGKPAPSSKRSSLSIGTSQATFQSEKYHLAAFKAACNICLPWRWFRFAILPDNIVLQFLAIAMVVVSYYDCTTILYEFTTQSINFPLLCCAFLMESVFYLRILLSFHEAYMDRSGNYITQFKKLARHYFSNRTAVFWDVVPNLPVEPLCFFFSSENRMFALTSLRLIHLLRMEYIFKYFKKINNRLMTRVAFHLALKLTIFLTITLHVFSCFWLLLACPFGKCLPNSWVDVFNFRKHIPRQRYLVANYYIVSLATATGLGDIYPSTTLEVVFSILVMIICRFLTALIIGDLVTVINIATRSLVQYEYRIYCLRDFLLNQNLSGHQMEKLWGYSQNLWTQEKGQHIPKLLKVCPYVMRCDIMTVMFGQHLRKSFLFQGLNEALLRQLAACLTRVVFFSGNYIVQHGDTDQNMYFIHSGEVSVLTVHPNLTETQHELLKKRDMFGLAQGLYHGLPHHFSYRANTKVNILVLNLDSWYHMLKYFPDDKEQIYTRAQTVYIKV